jgi:hypothetical protein
MSWRRARGILFAAAALSAFGLLIWASDHITMQGERTIYTVKCEGGKWEGTRCTGRLVPAQRYGFRASPARGEVIYWVRGSAEPSGKLSGCKVVDRDNWSCTMAADQTPVAAFEMKKGRPTRADDPRVIAFREVPKWKWWLMDVGVGVFSEARS